MRVAVVVLLLVRSFVGRDHLRIAPRSSSCWVHIIPSRVGWFFHILDFGIVVIGGFRRVFPPRSIRRNAHPWCGFPSESGRFSWRTGSFSVSRSVDLTHWRHQGYCTRHPGSRKFFCAIPNRPYKGRNQKRNVPNLSYRLKIRPSKPSTSSLNSEIATKIRFLPHSYVTQF